MDSFWHESEFDYQNTFILNLVVLKIYNYVKEAEIDLLKVVGSSCGLHQTYFSKMDAMHLNADYLVQRIAVELQEVFAFHRFLEQRQAELVTELADLRKHFSVAAARSNAAICDIPRVHLLIMPVRGHYASEADLDSIIPATAELSLSNLPPLSLGTRFEELYLLQAMEILAVENQAVFSATRHVAQFTSSLIQHSESKGDVRRRKWLIDRAAKILEGIHPHDFTQVTRQGMLVITALYVVDAASVLRLRRSL